MWSVTDMQTGKITTVFELAGAGDMKDMFRVIAKFAGEMELEDCLVGVRKYLPDELRDDGTTSNTAAAAYDVKAMSGDDKALKKAEKKLAKAEKEKHLPVAGEGDVLVTSFTLNVIQDFGDVKEIEYLFYDDGWAGSLTVSKTGLLDRPMLVELSCHDRGKDLVGCLSSLVGDVAVAA